VDTPVKGRSCGMCSLCCKLLDVREISKPEGKWCVHCVPGRERCTIYDRRPNQCRKFHCGWLMVEGLSDDWRPAKSKMVLCTEAGDKRIAVHVDPAFPKVWREEPYYGTLKDFARQVVDAGGQVVVYVKRHAFVILPKEDVDLGELAPGDDIGIDAKKTSRGRVFAARKIAAVEPASRADIASRSTPGARADLIRRALPDDVRRVAAFHDIDRAIEQMRPGDQDRE